LLGITRIVSEPANIGRQIPRHVVEEAGGLQNLRTFRLGPNLKIHRRCDDRRVRRPVNGRRGFKTIKFTSVKCGGRDVHSESGGEFSLDAALEVHPSIGAYRDQYDLVEIEDDDGLCWAVPDAYVLLRDGTPTWIEGKYSFVAHRGDDRMVRAVKGPSVRVRTKLRRVQRAFRSSGYDYVVVNQDWTSHPIVSANIGLAFVWRQLDPTNEERMALLEIVGGGPVTVGDCVAAFLTRNCPEEWICASMARGLIEIELSRRFSRESAVALPSAPFWAPRRHAWI